MTKEQEDIKYLKESVCVYKNTIPKISEAIETVLNMLKEKEEEIEKKDKMIDLMAEYIDGDDTSLANYLFRKNGKCNKEMIKKYFENMYKTRKSYYRKNNNEIIES